MQKSPFSDLYTCHRGKSLARCWNFWNLTTPGIRRNFVVVRRGSCCGSTVVVHVVVQCRGSNVMVQCHGLNQFVVVRGGSIVVVRGGS